MIEVARIDVTYTGGAWKTFWRVLPSAHSVGVSSASGHRSFRVLDDLGTPYGATRAYADLYAAAGDLGREIKGAWSTSPLF